MVNLSSEQTKRTTLRGFIILSVLHTMPVRRTPHGGGLTHPCTQCTFYNILGCWKLKIAKLLIQKNKWQRRPLRLLNSAPFPTIRKSASDHPWRLHTLGGCAPYNVVLSFLICWWWEVVVYFVLEDDGDGCVCMRRRLWRWRWWWW